MRMDVDGLLKKLWIICFFSAVALVFIYIIWLGTFDATFYKTLALLLLGYLPFTIFRKYFSMNTRQNILLLNMYAIIFCLSWFLPFYNHLIVIFLPLMATLYKSRLIFYLSSAVSIILHFGVNYVYLDHHNHYLEGVIELAYIICYLFFLLIILNISVENSKHSYMFDKTVKTLILAIETKDMYTRGHSIRVSDYAMIIAEHLKTNGHKVDLDMLRISSLLHDIGKVYIPNEILSKSGKLTADEYLAIKKHPEYGATLAAELEYPKQIVEDIFYHHERHDGKGYPKGLKGNEIPLHSKIIALADTFDAITSTRSYRNAFSLEEAKEIILESMNTQFAPEFREVFLKVYPKLVACYHEKII